MSPERFHFEATDEEISKEGKNPKKEVLPEPDFEEDEESERGEVKEEPSEKLVEIPKSTGGFAVLKDKIPAALVEKLKKQDQERERENAPEEFEKVNQAFLSHFDESKFDPEEIVAEIVNDPDRAQLFFKGLQEELKSQNLSAPYKKTLDAALEALNRLSEDYMWSKKEGADTRNIMGALKRGVASYLDLTEKGPDQFDEEELKKHIANVESHAFSVQEGQYDHVKGKQPLSMEDTQETPIPGPTQKDLEITQEIPAAVVEKALAMSPERKEVLEAVATLPEKSRAETIRGWAGIAFTAQELKNKGFAQAFRFATGLFGSEENKQKADSEKSSVRLFLDAFGRQYEDLARSSEKQREVFVKSGKGVAGLATNVILTTRAGLSLLGFANPIGNIATWGALMARRGVEAAKETHFAKRSESFRIQDEQVAWEEAKRLESLVSEKTGKDKKDIVAGDISSIYLRELPKNIFDRLKNPDAWIGNYRAALGVTKMLDRVEAEITKAETAGVSPEDRQQKVDLVYKKYEKILRDLDRIVGDGTTIDVVGQRLMEAGMWSNRIATVVALESLVEGAYHIGQLFDGHEPTVDALRAEEVSKVPVSHDAPHAVEIPSEHGAIVFESPTSPEAFEAVTIEHGGSIWSSAHEAAEKAGLSKGQFAEAWGHSTVTLPDGREVPLAELNLVHEGDTLSYVPGEGGGVGHFEFRNASDIPYGDSAALPGAEEIHSDNFEQQEWAEPTTGGLEAEAIEPLPIAHAADVSVHEIAPVTEHAESLTHMPTLEEHVAHEFEKDMQAIFGGARPESSEWQQWKGVTVKKFMEYRFEQGTPAQMLHRYVEYVMKDSRLRPLGGLFRREETMEAYIRRALFIIVSKERRG